MLDLFASAIVATKEPTIAYPFDSLAIVSSPYSESRLHPILGVRRPHRAIDLAKPCGTPVKSSISGKISVAGSYGEGYGLVVITKNDRQKTLIAHLSKIYVKKGQQVEKGEVLAEVGTSGFSTGCHLHLEYFLLNDQQWRAVDPQLHFDNKKLPRN